MTSVSVSGFVSKAEIILSGNMQGVVRGVVNKHTQASEARTGEDPADSRLGEGWLLLILCSAIQLIGKETPTSLC